MGVLPSTGEGELGVVRRDLGDVVPDQLLNLAGLLVRDQPAGDLHARLLWNDGLHAVPLEPPHKPVISRVGLTVVRS